MPALRAPSPRSAYGLAFFALLAFIVLFAAIRPSGAEPEQDRRLKLAAKDGGEVEISWNDRVLGTGGDGLKRLLSRLDAIAESADERGPTSPVMLSIDRRLDWETVSTILKEGRKRVPLALAVGGKEQVIAPRESPPPDGDIRLPPITVRLKGTPAGELAAVELGRRGLGNDAHAFDRLNTEILKIIGRPGNPLTKDMQAVLHIDGALRMEWVLPAIEACAGREDPKTRRWVQYLNRIQFAEFVEERVRVTFDCFLVSPIPPDEPERDADSTVAPITVPVALP